MGPQPIRIDVVEEGTTAIVKVGGEIDLATSPTLAETLHALERGGDVVVDLTSVEFMDSTGVAVLIEFREQVMREDESLSVLIAGQTMRRLFEIAGLFEILDVIEAGTEDEGGDDRG